MAREEFIVKYYAPSRNYYEKRFCNEFDLTNLPSSNLPRRTGNNKGQATHLEPTTRSFLSVKEGYGPQEARR
jgi:hypothetical protein